MVFTGCLFQYCGILNDVVQSFANLDEAGFFKPLDAGAVDASCPAFAVVAFTVPAVKCEGVFFLCLREVP